jgi:putative SOS response-associated peptidase YedK
MIMCGRARLSSDVSEIKLVFGIPPERPTPNIAPSWNVAPTDPLPVVRYDAKAGARSLDVMRWGLVPFWAKDIKTGFAAFNAKAGGSRASRPSATHFSGSVASCHWITFMNGRRPRRASNPTRLYLPTGA